MASRLSESPSLYLRQHADEPVDWFPWCDEAFEEAERRGVPVFLSVGYATCHWCHVMAHESFDDAEVAQILNESFVSIKVDREQHPDVDEAYMAAVQLSSGRGGWPMSVFLTPESDPFLAGTYWPRDRRGGHPGFLDICAQVAKAWEQDRPSILAASKELADAVRRARSRPAPSVKIVRPELLEHAVRHLAETFDDRHGGFGGAPKFPPHTAISMLLAVEGDEALASVSRTMAVRTLGCMVRSGLHDHVAGGFHRYSTDAEWHLPHFEKTLPDNALMLRNLALATKLGGSDAPVFLRAARRTAEWMERELRLDDGLLGSGLDADVDGEEGRSTVWSCDEVRALLGVEAESFLAAFRFEEEGNYEDEATGRRTGLNIPTTLEADARHDDVLEQLRIVRSKRAQPALDDKAVVGWNGLAISGLSAVGDLDAARRIADRLLEACRQCGRLPRLLRGGNAYGDGFLEDYAYAARGLFDLARASGEVRWSEEAARLTTRMVDEFYDAEEAGFFHVARSQSHVLGTSKPLFDQPSPSGNAVGLSLLIEVGGHARAEACLEALGGWIVAAPHGTEALLEAAMPLLGEPVSVRQPLPSWPVVRIEAEESWPVGADDRARSVVTIHIPPGLHIQGPQPGVRWLQGLELTCDGLDAWPSYPPAGDDGLEGSVAVAMEIRVPGAVDRSVLRVRFQPCTDQECLAAEELCVPVQFVRG